MKACPESSHHSAQRPEHVIFTHSASGQQCSWCPSGEERGFLEKEGQGGRHYSPGVHQLLAFLGDLVFPKDPSANKTVCEETPLMLIPFLGCPIFLYRPPK